MFFEEWELITEPALLQPLPVVNLSGMAIKEDLLGQRRKELDDNYQDYIKDENASEIINDILYNVKTPTPPLPNMRDPETFKKYFEENNKHLGLYYSRSTMDQFFELLEDTQFRLGYPQRTDDEADRNTEWDAKIEFIEGLIN